MKARVYLRFMAAAMLAAVCLASPVSADDETELSGSPVVQESGLLVLDGQKIDLWGITTLDGDQQCWHGQNAWSCGEQAAMALRHYVEGQFVKCRVKDKLEGVVSAQCFRQRGGKEQDVASILVRHGWAMDQSDESDGLYADDQEHARQKRRGIWTSRFQTPEDWREGLQRFVNPD